MKDIDVFYQEFRDFVERNEDKYQRNEDDHRKILEQTIKTNGTVASLQRWRWMLVGGLSVVTVLLIPILLLLLGFFLK
jgi:hypothetical protein